jgi:hypothetical protein
MISGDKVVELGYREQAFLQRIRSTHCQPPEAATVIPTMTANLTKSALEIKRISIAC